LIGFLWSAAAKLLLLQPRRQLRCRTPKKGDVMRFIIILLLAFIPVFAWAVTPQFWENFSQEDLLQGSLDHIYLSSDGKLFIGPAYDLFFDTGQSYIFSVVRDKSGNLYVGTGDGGKVYKVDPNGKGTLYFQSKELNIFSMALDSSDILYVGTSPDGKVYKVTGPNQASEYCNPDEKYIWSMVFDVADNLYIGTGPSGIIFKVDKTGKKSSFYTCADSNAVSLFHESNGNLLAGTSPGGLVIEITPEGKGFALMDSPLEEVHAFAVDRFGTIYAIASSSRDFLKTPQAKTKPASTSATLNPVVTVTIESITSIADKSDEKNGKTTAPGGEKDSTGFKSAVYALNRDGSVETIYTSNDQMAYDLLVRGDGSILLATGPKGRLLSIDTAKQVTVVSDSPEEDMTKLLAAGDVTYVAGSNQGKVYRLQNQRAQSGTFESKTLDAKTVASWGKISWRAPNSAETSVTIFTRSGNTEKADSSWSIWSDSYSAPGQQITSPRARYLQWRASFKRNAGSAQSAPSDALDGVQIAYLQQNLRPQVVNIEVLPYGVELQKQSSLTLGITAIVPSTTSDGRSLNAPREHGRERQPLAPRQVLQPGAQSFTWKAVDENDDTLEYSLYFKGEGESDWKLLEKKLADAFYALNAASLPDGPYRLKVVASDAPSNPYDRFLIGELISDIFTVANTSPQVEIANSKVNGKKIEIQFRAHVPVGSIATAEFSIDGGDWNLIFPLDGIADSTQEDYRFVTWELPAGEHLVGIRASDRNGNTGTSKQVVKIQ
jgi:hypothetical protein